MEHRLSEFDELTSIAEWRVGKYAEETLSAPFRIAVELIKSHGKDALAVAADRALDARMADDLEQEATWLLVMDEIEELLRMEPKPGATMH